jgi:hypothetical protein
VEIVKVLALQAAWFFACGALILVVVFMVLAFPCFVIGLLASPLCGAALTFFAAVKKVSKESGLTPPASSEPSLASTGNGPTRDLPSHFPR